ncbi:SMP-30/gluconolactonase/LRE family protein [Clostridium sediminicola]|uniref:SMP-30/gluconolactonase/LRE family protein n=1 Tax=Clostridium sediminicola TaxID=3114879 RepID=UPI0031F266CB
MPIKLEVFDEKIFDIISLEQELKVVASGFTFIEGPIWNEKEKHLIFNDIPESVTYKLDKNGDVSIVIKDNNKSNGNCYDNKGRIISCEHTKSRLSMMNVDGSNRKVLISHYNGKELNSPNDVVVKSDGTIYFTDPRFGRNPSRVGVPREQELNFQGVFKLCSETHELTLLADHFENPNGLCFSKDERQLFVNDSPRKTIEVFDIDNDGNLDNKRIWAVTEGEGPGLPDGMKIDSEGNLYCCAQGGLHIFDKNARCLGVVHIPEQLANFTFGGSDLKTLYLAASTTVYTIRGKVPF